MAPVARARRNMTIVLGSVMALLGVAMIVTTLAGGGGPTALGIIVGAAFAILGAGRVYLEIGSRSEHRS